MAGVDDPVEIPPFSFSDFPEDVQLCVLSFLTPPDISAFACTSRRSVSLCRSDRKLWFAMCDRRWGSKTQIRKWGNGKVTYKSLYKTLSEYENLIGFWRRSGNGKGAGVESPELVFFEWGNSFVTGSKVLPSKSGTYSVVKAPLLLMGISPNGEPLNFLDPECRLGSSDDFANSVELDSPENDLVPVNLNFMGASHVVIEENLGFSSPNSPELRNNGKLRGDDYGAVEDVIGSPGSLPDRMTSEIYQYFANRTSPGGDRASRRQRRREKERQGRRKKWEAEHYVKIVHCSPTPSRPLQGLWKGIGDDMNLYFYLVAYDDIGGIACRKVGDSSRLLSNYSPVFWTSNTTFIEYPFSPEEQYFYDSRTHVRPHYAPNDLHKEFLYMESEAVSRILYINNSYDLVIPDLVGTSASPRDVEGRIWQYEDGTFGFGFRKNNYIIDLKHIARNGCLLDIVEEQSSD